MNGDFKEKVIKRRKEIGLSQLELATALGYTPQAISKFEKSNSSFPITILPKLANALDTTIDSLFAPKHSSFHADKPYQDFDVSLFADNLKNLRKGLGLTIGDAAKKLDVSPRSLAAYEKGETVMPISCFERSLSLYRISAEEILYEPQEDETEIVTHIIEPTAPEKHPFWSKTKAIALACSVVIALSIAIPLSIVYGTTAKKEESLTSSTGNDDVVSSSEEIVATMEDLPSDFHIEPVGFSSEDVITKGDYTFKMVFPEGYTLHEGIGIQWGYSGGADMITVVQENEYEIESTFHVTQIYWKDFTGGVQAALLLEDYFMTRSLTLQFHNDNGELSPSLLPGLNAMYLEIPNADNNTIKRGVSYDVHVKFKSSEFKTFVFSEEKYDLTNSLSYMTGPDYSGSDPMYMITIPSSSKAGSINLNILINAVGSNQLYPSDTLAISIVD